MNKDQIAITITAVLFTLACVLPLGRAARRRLTQRAEPCEIVVAIEAEDDYSYEASPDGVKAGALARGKYE